MKELAVVTDDLARLLRWLAGSGAVLAVLAVLAGEREDFQELLRLAAAGSSDTRDVHSSVTAPSAAGGSTRAGSTSHQ
jgi:hypothetical protein